MAAPCFSDFSQLHKLGRLGLSERAFSVGRYLGDRMTNDVEPPAIVVSIWVMATGVLDDEDLDDPNEISFLRADRLSGIVKLIRDYVHPSHWPGPPHREGEAP